MWLNLLFQIFVNLVFIMNNSFSTIILSSGLSERMGQPKALLQWNESTIFLEKIIHEYSNAGCNRIVCIINRFIEPFCKKLNVPNNVKFIVNEYPTWGRFYSIRLASKEVKDSHFTFIQNVDNPFVNVEIIEKLYTKRNQEAWCSPVYNEKSGHPVLLPRFIIEKISRIKSNDYTLQAILEPFKRINVEMDTDIILRNINTPEDYARFFS